MAARWMKRCPIVDLDSHLDLDLGGLENRSRYTSHFTI